MEEECFSAFDFNEEYDRKQTKIARRSQDVATGFENWGYFKRIFPTQRIQKPGYELYGTQSFILVVLAIYSFMGYDHMTVNEFQLLPGAKDSSNLFQEDMTIQMCFVLTLIFVERYVSRTNSYKYEEKSDVTAAGSNYFEDKILKSTSDAAMAIKLNTFQTANVDVHEVNT